MYKIQCTYTTNYKYLQIIYNVELSKFYSSKNAYVYNNKLVFKVMRNKICYMFSRVISNNECGEDVTNEITDCSKWKVFGTQSKLPKTPLTTEEVTELQLKYPHHIISNGLYYKISEQHYVFYDNTLLFELVLTL